MADPAQHKREIAPGLADQWRHCGVICFCVSASCWRLHPFLGPCPQAYAASKFRSLRRAPGPWPTCSPASEHRAIVRCSLFLCAAAAPVLVAIAGTARKCKGQSALSRLAIKRRKTKAPGNSRTAFLFFARLQVDLVVVIANCTINPPTPCLWQARPASAQTTKKGNQAGHLPKRGWRD